MGFEITNRPPSSTVILRLLLLLFPQLLPMATAFASFTVRTHTYFTYIQTIMDGGGGGGGGGGGDGWSGFLLFLTCRISPDMMKEGPTM